MAILGLGSWGTALACILARDGHDVHGWTHDPEQRRKLAADRENRKYLPGIAFPTSLRIEDTIGGVMTGAAVLLCAVPSHAVRDVSGAAAAAIPAGVPVVNVAKGLEESTLFRMSEVLDQVLREHGRTDVPIVSLLGPSHAEEVSRDHPTALVAASADARAAAVTQELLSSETLRVYTSPDLVGVELAAGLKNVIAIAAGISVGVGYGDNSMGALVTRGLAEITRLGVARGGRAATFSGLSGLGDLVTTCISRHSRNRYVGEEIGRGRTPEEVLGGMSMVAEGVRTTRACRDMARNAGVEMPIADQVHEVLFSGKNPRSAIRDLMQRDPKPELS